jgi:hypothetical protein
VETVVGEAVSKQNNEASRLLQRSLRKSLFYGEKQMNTGTLETIGYTEPDAAQRIAAFLAQPRTGLVDIRYSPYCRWDKQWNTQALLAKYGSTKYIHLKCFGNINYNRPGQPISLAHPGERLNSMVNALLHGSSLMLLCACKDYERCHRKTVYDLVIHALQERVTMEQALQAVPTMQYDPTRKCFAVPFPDGRLLCTTSENFLEATSTMPLAYLDDPVNWLPFVDGKTVWIEV